MKQTSDLCTLQNGSFRKGTLRFRFVSSILLERISLKLHTKKYSFISSRSLSPDRPDNFPNNPYDDFVGRSFRSTCCLGVNAFLFMFKYLIF